MSDEAAFLDALKANPADDTARLVYADWLDEHNEPQKAEYLRAVVEAAGDGEPETTRVLTLADELPLAWRARSAARFGLVFESFEPGRKSDTRNDLCRMTGMSPSEAFRFMEHAPSDFSYRTTLEGADGVVRHFDPGCLRLSSNIAGIARLAPTSATFSVSVSLGNRSWPEYFTRLEIPNPPEMVLTAFRESLARVMGISVATAAELVGTFCSATIAERLNYDSAQQEMKRCESVSTALDPELEWFIILQRIPHFQHHW